MPSIRFVPRYYRYFGVLLFIAAGLLFFTRWSSRYDPPQTDLKTTAFTRLGRIREAKKGELIFYFQNLERQAREIGNDDRMLEYFSRFSSGDIDALSHLDTELDIHYVTHYSDFYDILFVDTAGYIFHSIKRESDYHTNLRDGPLASTELVAQLGRADSDYFTGYTYYGPSDEPAAFFTTGVYRAGVLEGWFILQAPINVVNTILTDHQGLGRSGEVYLVNQDKLMLTESRFIEDATILKLKVDTRTVEMALKATSGESVIRDYRGIKVFSSFEKFDLFSTSWIIIAEIDEEEVFTDYYQENKSYFQRELQSFLERRFLHPQPLTNDADRVRRVDMNEFTRVLPGTVAQTYGVAACTGLALMYPGRFGYLAHIAPTDEIYSHGRITRWSLAKRRTNMVDEILRRMRRYDLLPSELQQLQVFIVAPHAIGFWGAVDRILANNMDLGNIRIMYNPRAVGVNIALDVQDSTVQLEWYSDSFSYGEWGQEAETLSDIMKKVLRY
ncbi:MAG: cache domain-containing protein [Candidatus Neomarinimicrobiota bacterium]